MTRTPNLITALVVATVLLAACGAQSSTPAPTNSSTPTAPSALPTNPGSTAPSTLPSPSTPAAAYRPVPRSAASMAWDPKHALVLLFGGDTEAGPTNDLDAWNGTAWAPLATDGPAARDDAILVPDPDRGVVVLFGGRTPATTFTDTWEWDGAAWHEIDVEGPPARAHAAAAYDAKSKRVILYGGAGEGDTSLHDTWAFDGATWTRLDDAGIPARVPSGMAWDPTLKQVVTLAVDLTTDDGAGLYASELWGWTGKAWKRVGAGPAPFSPLQSLVEGPRHPIFIDGGALQGTLTTSEWSGKGWAPMAPGGPGPRNGQSAAFDAERDELVVFGGFAGDATLGDTWRLAGGTWREVGT